MAKIVGIDFGTTNVRIAEWDTDGNSNPSSCPIGRERVTWMPATISFQRQPGGEVDIKFGEAAEELYRAPGVEVVRNIKRYALLSDNYVRDQLEWHVEQQEKEEEEKKWPPEWFDPDTRSIRLRNGETMAAAEAIRQILKEAISRAGLAGSVAEWRAGCPVSSGLAYRKALVSALDELGCTGKIEWITEEPLLLLALGKEIGSLKDGRYLVYDLGGGSFDCAIVEINGDQLIVLADEGLPTLGGMDIDDMLSEQLGYDGDPRLLRIAKEQLSAENTEIALDSGHILNTEHVEKVLKDGKFMEKTLTAVLNAYNKALLMIDPSKSYRVGGWKYLVESMTNDIDRVMVVGGPILMPYFPNGLRDIFGNEKVVTADELARAADRTDISDPALTALSHGACYMYGKRYVPITIDRIPARITLKVTDGHSTEEDSYEPFHRLPFRRPLAPHVGRLIIQRPLYQETTTLNGDLDSEYSVLIESSDGDTLREYGPYDMRMPRNYTGPRADRIRLVVDRLGGVTVKLEAGFTDIPSPSEDVVPIELNPPWQPDLQEDGPIKERLETGRKSLDGRESTVLSLGMDPYGVETAYGRSRRRG